MEQRPADGAPPVTRYKAEPCERCGGGIELVRAARKAKYCSACREARFVENMASMMLKEGEPYRRAVAARQQVRDNQRRGGRSTA
jgi:hypothetical protein